MIQVLLVVCLHIAVNIQTGEAANCVPVDCSPKVCRNPPGFVKLPNGCLDQKCQCGTWEAQPSTCPPWECTNNCIYGYVKDSAGCYTCTCKTSLETTSLTNSTSGKWSSVASSNTWRLHCTVCYRHPFTNLFERRWYIFISNLIYR